MAKTSKTESRNASSSDACTPFLKWPGGKRWLAEKIVRTFPSSSRLVEPFCGAAACFFEQPWKAALLADTNEELINAFQVVKEDADDLIERLLRISIDRNTYYKMRSSRPRTDLTRATRFIYLNRTAFNGIYRVNQKGQFNVPFGCKPNTKVCDVDNLKACSRRLREAEIKQLDFTVTLDLSVKSDSIFIDPPYASLGDNDAFRRYNPTVFQWYDQVKLASTVNEMARLGHKLIVTNANTREIRNLYDRNLFAVQRVYRHCRMAAMTTARKPVSELLLVSVACESDQTKTLN